MDKKEEKIDQEELLEQQVNRRHNVWLVIFFALLSLLSIFVFYYSEKVFYNRVNFVFEKKNVESKEESKWELLNRRFLTPLLKIFSFAILMLSIIAGAKILTLILTLKCLKCFKSEKEEFKKVDDIRSIFFYDRDHCEVEEELAKIRCFICGIYSEGNNEKLKFEKNKKIEKLKLILNLNYNSVRPINNMIELFDDKYNTSDHDKALQLQIKKKFNRFYYKYMNNSSFLLQNKDFYNYKNNACISFILSFFEYLYYLSANEAAVKEFSADIENSEKKEFLEKFDEIYKKKFDFVVEKMKKFFSDDILKKEKEKKQEQEEGNEIKKQLEKSKVDEDKEEKKVIPFQYFSDVYQKNFSITLEGFFDYLWSERVKKKKKEDPNYDEEKELSLPNMNNNDKKVYKDLKKINENLLEDESGSDEDV